ncbi:MAG: ABC transporter permease [Planctomycetota bacterium]
MTKKLIYGIAWIVFAIAVLAPCVTIIIEAFTADGRFSLVHLSTVLADAREWTLLANTLYLASASAAFSFILGVPAGFLISRSDVPFRGFFRSIIIVPLFMPPLVHAIAWTGMTGLRGGFAASLTFGIAYFPIVALLAARAFERVDRRFEEAAALAGGALTKLKISIRLALPPCLAGALCTFIFASSDFSVTDYYSSVGPKFNVFADEVFARWQREGSSGSAVAAALVPVVIDIICMWLIFRLKRKSHIGIVTSGFVAPGVWKLGNLRYLSFAFLAAVTLVSCVIPVGYFIYTAGSLQVFREALAQARGEITQTFIVSIMMAAAGAVLAIVLAHSALRSKRNVAPAVEWLTLLPFAIPAIALAIAIIRVWNHGGLAGFIYESPVVVGIAFLARYFVFAYQSAAAGVAAIDPNLEHAAQLSGASFGAIITKITAPLALPAAAAAFLLLYVFGMRELDTIVLIPAGNQSAMFRIYNAIHFNRPQFVAALCIILLFMTAFPLIVYQIFARKRAGVLI